VTQRVHGLIDVIQRESLNKTPERKPTPPPHVDQSGNESVRVGVTFDAPRDPVEGGAATFSRPRPRSGDG
jgi:hypothetical protein